jgi:hypothetical protein
MDWKNVVDMWNIGNVFTSVLGGLFVSVFSFPFSVGCITYTDENYILR